MKNSDINFPAVDVADATGGGGDSAYPQSPREFIPHGTGAEDFLGIVGQGLPDQIDGEKLTALGAEKVPKRRGRPPNSEKLAAARRKPGRPRKTEKVVAARRGPGLPPKTEKVVVARRGPGRPPKTEKVVAARRGPGRPPKTEKVVAARRGPGRPPKTEKVVAARRGPGRPPKTEKVVAARRGPGRPPKTEKVVAARRGPGRPPKTEKVVAARRGPGRPPKTEKVVAARRGPGRPPKTEKVVAARRGPGRPPKTEKVVAARRGPGRPPKTEKVVAARRGPGRPPKTEKVVAARRGPGRPPKTEKVVAARRGPGRPPKTEKVVAARRGPGRPPKTEKVVAARRGPGRPPKTEKVVVARRGPGRPPKTEKVVVARRGPGRPRKVENVMAARRGPGRPRKVEKLTAARRGPGRPPKAEKSTAVRRGPGRPPKAEKPAANRRGPGRPPKAEKPAAVRRGPGRPSNSNKSPTNHRGPGRPPNSKKPTTSQRGPGRPPKIDSGKKQRSSDRPAKIEATKSRRGPGRPSNTKPDKVGTTSRKRRANPAKPTGAQVVRNKSANVKKPPRNNQPGIFQADSEGGTGKRVRRGRKTAQADKALSADANKSLNDLNLPLETPKKRSVGRPPKVNAGAPEETSAASRTARQGKTSGGTVGVKDKIDSDVKDLFSWEFLEPGNNPLATTPKSSETEEVKSVKRRRGRPAGAKNKKPGRPRKDQNITEEIFEDGSEEPLTASTTIDGNHVTIGSRDTLCNVNIEPLLAKVKANGFVSYEFIYNMLSESYPDIDNIDGMCEDIQDLFRANGIDVYDNDPEHYADFLQAGGDASIVFSDADLNADLEEIKSEDIQRTKSNMQIYFENVNKYPLLTFEEEKSVAKEIDTRRLDLAKLFATR